jgi:hypothetical protein
MDRHDDPSIDGEMVLVRRIPPWGGRVQWDENSGEPTPSSQNFRDPEKELSTYIVAEATIELVLAGHDGFGLVQFTAGEARKVLGTDIVFCRDTSDPIPGHVLICGNITNGMARRFRDIVSWAPGRWPSRLPPDEQP